MIHIEITAIGVCVELTVSALPLHSVVLNRSTSHIGPSLKDESNGFSVMQIERTAVCERVEAFLWL